VPRGAYLLTGPDGPYAVERFSCAPGPAGWRYVATRQDPDGRPLGRVDLVLDGAGRALRVQVQAGGWQVRGGVVGDRCVWRRGEHEHADRAAGFTGTSPGWLVATARLVAGRAPVRVRLVRLSDEALASRTVEQGWSAAGSRVEAGLPVEAYDVDELDTGERRRVHLSGDVVVAAPGVALLELDGPPTTTGTWTAGTSTAARLGSPG